MNLLLRQSKGFKVDDYGNNLYNQTLSSDPRSEDLPLILMSICTRGIQVLHIKDFLRTEHDTNGFLRETNFGGLKRLSNRKQWCSFGSLSQLGNTRAEIFKISNK